MAGMIEERLRELGITLPEAAKPVANYVPAVLAGGLLVVSGQLPMRDGAVAFVGKLGRDVNPADAAVAAQLCFLNVLAQTRAALDGDLDRVARGVRLGGFVSCVPEFTAMAAVMNGASDLAVAVFGDAGRHARSTIGVPALPGDATVEVEATFAVR